MFAWGCRARGPCDDGGVADDARRGVFIGRRSERDRLAALITDAQQGRSGALVMRGGAGMGKSYLLEAVAHDCGDRCRVLTVSGVESEMVIDYAALQRFYVQLGADEAALPDGQRRALRAAIGAEDSAAPDPHLVGLALVNLLSDAGALRSLLCIVDDAQWIDERSRRTLGFVARRLRADRVAMIFATREGAGADNLDGIPEFALRPFDDAEARALLEASLPGRLDSRVLERILADAHGNPLALTELPRAVRPAQLAGGFALDGQRAFATAMEESFAARVKELPDATRLLLLIAAAEPVGDPAWLWAAADAMGVDVEDAQPAERAGLITLDTRIVFRHPLVRSAVYRSEPAARRHRVHTALADAMTGPDTADYRAWHHARAIASPSESVAVELVASAERARQRGGVAATAAFLEYAVDLTPDAALRARRAVQAAAAKLDAGDPPAAARMIEVADAAAIDDGHSARVALLRAHLAFATDRGRDGPGLLLDAARALSDHEPLLARETYLSALMAAMIVGRLADDADHEPAHVAEAARHGPPAPTPPRAVDLLLDGLAARLHIGYAAAAPLLKIALHAYMRDVHAGTADPRWHDITNRICLDLFDFATYRDLATRQLELLREAGELTVLPAALTTLAAVRVIDGDFDGAQALLDEAFIVSAATSAPPHRSGTALLAAHRGDETLWLDMSARTIEEASARGEGTEVTVTCYSQALLYNGLSRYPEAYEACRLGQDYDDIGLSGSLLLEFVEAASYTADFAVARDASDELARRASASATESALGLAARAAALAKGERATDADFRKALTHLERSPLKVYRARTHLVYGEWLRRVGRDGDARTQLRIAHDMCAAMGADGFTARAARELHAAGGRFGERGHRYDAELTTQERHISRLVRQGQTNAEIGEQLLISHRTVEWHLRNIYQKLGISSRRQLRAMDL